MLPCTPWAGSERERRRGTSAFVDEGDEDADDGVQHGHEADGDPGGANHGLLAVATEVFLRRREGRKRMKPMQ